MAWIHLLGRIIAKEIQAELQGGDMSVSDRTIRHFLSESGLHGRRTHKKDRLEFAQCQKAVSVAVHGSSNRIMTQVTPAKSTPE